MAAKPGGEAAFQSLSLAAKFDRKRLQSTGDLFKKHRAEAAAPAVSLRTVTHREQTAATRALVADAGVAVAPAAATGYALWREDAEAGRLAATALCVVVLDGAAVTVEDLAAALQRPA